MGVEPTRRLFDATTVLKTAGHTGTHALPSQSPIRYSIKAMFEHTHLSRRQILKAGTAAALLPGIALAQPQRKARIAFFSDTHVGVARNVEECRKMLAEVKKHEPNAAINAGDVTDYGWNGEYANWKTLLEEFKTPVWHAPGNHDVRWSPLGLKGFEEVCGAPYSAQELGGVLFVQLDSTVPLSHYGHIESPQLAWLRKTLSDWGNTRPVVIASHHWFGRDRTMIDNQEDFYALLDGYNVVAVLSGHGHLDITWQWGRFPCFMNRGLYQGSFCLLDIEGSNLVVTRWTQESGLAELARLPLDSAIPAPVRPTVGEISLAEARSMQFEGALTLWNGRASEAPTMPGTHLIAVQDGTRRRSARVRIDIPSDAPLQLAYRKYLPGGVMSHLTLDGDLLFISMMDGSVMAVRAHDGATVWEAKTGGYCHSSPYVFGDRVFVGSADGALYAFDRSTGAELWKLQTDGPVYGSPVAAKGNVVFSSGDGAMRGVDAKTGVRAWSFAFRPRGVPPFSQSRHVTDGERVYVGAWDTNLYAFDPRTGQPVWIKKATERSFAFSPAIGSPAVSRGRVYAVANSNGLISYDAVTGEKQWEVASPGEKFGYSGPLVMGSMIVAGCLGDEFGEVRGVSTHDGRELWATRTGFSIYDSSACQLGRYVAIGSVDSVLNLLEAKTGRLAQQLRLPPGHFLSSPAASARRLFVATLNGELWALDLKG